MTRASERRRWRRFAPVSPGESTPASLWHSDLLRMQGDLALEDGSAAQCEAGEALLEQAIEIARKQRAKSLELRAAVSLARLWRKRGEKQRGHELLAPIFGSFTQGFDTVDLRAAAALLQDGAGRR